MNKKIISVLLVLSMLVGMLAMMPITIGAAEVTADNANIVINSVQDWLDKLSGKSIGNQTVFVNATELDFSGKNVQPIQDFKGHFNGNGVIIKNMNITTTGETGIFNCIEAAVTIENLVIENSSFEGEQWVGSVVCCIGHGSDSDYATIRNVYVGKDVIVTATGKDGKAYAGGIVGGIAANGYVKVTDCAFEGSVTADNSTAQKYMSGIVGNINAKKYVVVESCLFTGDVTNGDTSNISGIMDGSSQTGSKIDYCITILAEDTIIKDSNKYSSGIAKGNYNWSTLRNVYGLSALANDPADETNLIGKFTARDKDVMIPNGVKALETLNPSFTVPASIYYGTVSEAEPGTVTFQNWDGTVLQSDALEGDAMPTYRGETPTRPDEKFYTYKFKGWNPEIVKVNGAAVYTATFTKSLIVEDPTEVNGEYVINNVYQYLYFMKNASDYNGKTVVLGADLDFTGADGIVKPISGFAGTFDGKGYAIKNLVISGSGSDIALFGDTKDSEATTIKNFTIKSSTFKIENGSGNWLGTVVSSTSSRNLTISNIYVDKDVNVISKTSHSNSIAGGILGGVYGDDAVVKVTDCVFAGTVIGSGNYVAGIVSNAEAGNETLVSNCVNVGRVISEGTLVAGIAVSGEITIENCVNAGKVSGRNYVGGIYAGNPTGDVVIRNCYTVDNLEGHNTENGGDVKPENCFDNLEFKELIGLNAKVPATFTKRSGDFAVPTACTVAPSILLTQQMIDGASVRLDKPTGLRFKAVLGKAFLDSIKTANEGKEVTYGIIITPEDYITEAGGEFTIEALSKLNYETNYLEINADKLLDGGDDAGYYLFSGVIYDIDEGNYTREFSARAYVKVDDGNGNVTYYYSAYDSDVNSRSIADVAKAAYEDTNNSETDKYKYEIAENSGVYSPYEATKRALLPSFFEKVAMGAYFMTYNIRNVEKTDSIINASEVPTYEYPNREQYVLAYLLSSGADVIGLQEVSKLTSGGETLDWFDVLDGENGLIDAGYACFKGENILSDYGGTKEMYNPIYYKTSKYDFVTGGYHYLGAYTFYKDKDTINTDYKGLSWVMLEDRATGERFVYVNVHMPRKGVNDVHQQDDAAADLMEYIEEMFASVACPIFIGGDFNGSYSVYKEYKAEGDEKAYWGEVAVNARTEATNKINASTVINNEFTAVADPSAGPIDLYFVVNSGDTVIHSYAVTDNKVTEIGQYPSDHLPVKLVVTIYCDINQ